LRRRRSRLFDVNQVAALHDSRQINLSEVDDPPAEQVNRLLGIGNFLGCAFPFLGEDMTTDAGEGQ
jgi:hypothetical protein